MDAAKEPLMSGIGAKDAECRHVADEYLVNRYSSHLRQRRTFQSLYYSSGAFVLMLLGFFLGSLMTGASSQFLKSQDLCVKQQAQSLRKPSEFRVIGMVFYGRPQFVDILDCYLRKNLAVNGGFLDEVHFMAHTENETDLAWLDDLVAEVPEYRVISGKGSYVNLWRHATEDDTMYIKIDDDLVYIDDNAIPRLVHTLQAHPEAYGVAANLVNSPIMSWLHWHNGAVYPYLPELARPPSSENETWRASALPIWYGKVADKYDFGRKPPFDGHRWLPLPHTMENVQKTPIANAEYDAFGTGLKSWAMAAQQHYSFFENLEEDRLDKYWAGTQDGIWNMWYQHYNINLLAVFGSTVLATPFFDWWIDDEWAMSEIIPKQLQKPLLVDTHSIVSHFSFHPQFDDMSKTDLLSRYRAYANERVCAAGNQKSAYS